MVAVMETTIAPKDNSQAFDLMEALKLRFRRGWSLPSIAHHMQIPLSTLYARLQAVSVFFKGKGAAEANQIYIDFRSEFLNTAERVILTQMMEPETLKRASFNNLAYGFQQIHTARRLEMDLSTANVSSRVQVRDMQPAEKERLDKALEAMYSPTPANAKVEGDGHGAP